MDQNQILDIQIKAEKIYSDRAIRLGSFFGGPLVVGYFMAQNFKSFGELEKVKKTWMYTIIITVILFVVIFSIPENVSFPNQILPIIQVLVASALVKKYQGANIEAHRVANGEFYSWWRVVGVSLIGLIVLVVAILVVSIGIDMVTSSAVN